MSGNGTHAARQQQLESLERAIGDMVEQRPGDDFLARMQSALSLARQAGQILSTKGNDDAQEAAGFADHVHKLAQQFVGDLIARKRRELADLERVMGKLA
jgi:hypothetical protein